MSLLKYKKPDFNFNDDRGSLTQLVHSGYEQVNVLISKKGVKRGGHYHKISTECFYVVNGMVKVTAKNNNECQCVTFKQGDFFEIEPYIIHSMDFPEECVLIAMYDKSIEGSNGEKDIYSE